MRYGVRLLLTVLMILLFVGRTGVSAQTTVTIGDQKATLNFPNQATFTAHITDATEITQVILEYGVEKRTCGTVTAEAYPTFTVGKTVDATWTWDMRKSGSEPPGTTIWYRWQVTDKDGSVTESPKQTVVWLDNQFAWQSVTREMLTLHWYNGSSTFATELLNSAVDSIHKLSQTTGVVPDSPINLYIYGSFDDLHKATLYQAGWTGGIAFPAYNITIIGISPNLEAWGKRTEAHELTHVMIGHLIFGCLTSIPTWLNEGLAVYNEGGLDATTQDLFQKAVNADKLLPIRSLSGNFSEVASTADLSYSESYSIVNYLIKQFGQANMTKLLENIRAGMVIEAALQGSYSVGLDELERRWRDSIGAVPHLAAGITPTVSPSPTAVPTYQLITSANAN